MEFDFTDYVTINVHTPLREAIKKLNDTADKIVFVIDRDSSLVGTLTDGDIRRYIEKNGPKLDVTVFDVMNKHPKFVYEEQLEKLMYSDFLKYKVNFLPVIDKNKRIKNVIHVPLNFQRIQQFKSKVLIMAGGKGTRLYPLTKVIPKPLVPFGAKTIVEQIMDNFIKSGFDEFIVSVKYKKEMIKEYLKNTRYNVSFIEERDFLGTAGSIGLLREHGVNKPFIVTNCDILIDLDFTKVIEFHVKEKAHLTIIASIERVHIPYGVIEVDKENKYVSIAEKPNYEFLVNTGIYVLSPEIIELVRRNEKLDMPELIERIKRSGMSIKIFNAKTKMIDIGQWEHYKEALQECF